jgi:hypothetical protein
MTSSRGSCGTAGGLLWYVTHVRAKALIVTATSATQRAGPATSASAAAATAPASSLGDADLIGAAPVALAAAGLVGPPRQRAAAQDQRNFQVKGTPHGGKTSGPRPSG